jgi:hypothetical protein
MFSQSRPLLSRIGSDRPSSASNAEMIFTAPILDGSIEIMVNLMYPLYHLSARYLAFALISFQQSPFYVGL